MKKFLPKNIFLRLILIVILIYFGLNLLLLWLDREVFAYIPPNWHKYSNQYQDIKYSFSYPPEWVMSDCGNGEIVLAKTKIEKCLFPLSASNEYLNQVYVQTFVPTSKYKIIPFAEASPSGRLKDWHEGFVGYGDDFGPILNQFLVFKINTLRDMVGDAFPVGIETNPQPNIYENVYVGVYPHPEIQNEMSKVFDSIHFSTKE